MGRWAQHTLKARHVTGCIFCRYEQCSRHSIWRCRSEPMHLCSHWTEMHTCCLSQRAMVVRFLSQPLDHRSTSSPDTQGGVMTCHALAQPYQEGRTQGRWQAWQQQGPCCLAQAVQGIKCQIVSVGAGLLLSSLQAPQQSCNCCMACSQDFVLTTRCGQLT